MEHIWWKLNLHENSCKPQQKSHIIHEKIAYVDDMMIHNLVKYLLQTQLCLWDIKITNFKKFVIFISHKRSRVWIRYFIRLCIIISSTYVIFSTFLSWFARVFTKLWFAPDMFPINLPSGLYQHRQFYIGNIIFHIMMNCTW